MDAELSYSLVRLRRASTRLITTTTKTVVSYAVIGFACDLVYRTVKHAIKK